MSTPGVEVHTAAWSPDSTRLAYTGDADGDNSVGLYTVDWRGTNHRTHVEGDNAFYVKVDSGAAWYDGALYFTYHEPEWGTELWRVLDQEGAPLERLTMTSDTSEEIPQGHVRTRSDGSKIIFVGYGSSGWKDVFSVDLDGSDQCRINPGLGHTDDFGLLPDGERLVYATGDNHDATHTIYGDDVPCGGDESAVTADGVLHDYLEYVVSPDGTMIAYTTGIVSQRSIVLCDVDGSNCVSLVQGGDNFFQKFRFGGRIGWNPRAGEVWAPDSDRLYFSSNATGNYEIHSIKVDGTGRMQVTSDASVDHYAPFLSPDGTKLAYLRDDGTTKTLRTRRTPPDDCSVPDDGWGDCNNNQVLDACDIADETSKDCNKDGRPDECPLEFTVVQEAWDTIPSVPADCWSLECDADVCASINADTGNPAPSLNVGGTFGGEGTASLLRNDCVLPEFDDGLVIEADVWLTDTGCHFTDITFGLWQSAEPSINDPGNWLVSMWFNKGCVHNAVNLATNIGLPDEDGSGFLPGTFQPNAWNRGRILIRPDLRVEFYVRQMNDGWTHLWTSESTLDPDYSGQVALAILGKEGGGPARLDNLRVRQWKDIDCNENGVPDDCDIADGTSIDGNVNGLPDECEADCDGDGVIDDVDEDIDNDGVPNDFDECVCNAAGVRVNQYGRPVGDIDLDCDVDLDDFEDLQKNLTDPR